MAGCLEAILSRVFALHAAIVASIRNKLGFCSKCFRLPLVEMILHQPSFKSSEFSMRVQDFPSPSKLRGSAEVNGCLQAFCQRRNDVQS
eukprot:211780-Amphidinium_carterae.2